MTDERRYDQEERELRYNSSRREVTGVNFVVRDDENLQNKQREEDVIQRTGPSNNYTQDWRQEREYNKHYNDYDNPKRPRLISYFIVALVAALIGGLVSSYIAPMYLYGKIIPDPNYGNSNQNGQQIIIQPKDDVGAVEAVAKKSMKSVVGITTIREEEVDYWFWKVPVKRQGLGSGVIVSSNGFIITNSHVVADGQADEITVLFEDGTKKIGKVLWNSVIYDLAVVKVDATNLPVAELGDSEDLEVGELAVAIGNPLGLEFQRTVTSGVISGLNRTIVVENNEKIENLIQTDASINPGNSGGPLLNKKGQVIGINTAKIQGGEGLGLAIPINTVKPIVKKILDNGEFKQVYLGVSGVSVTQYEQALGVDIRADEGLYIVEVLMNSPAYYGGLKAGDIVLTVDNINVNTISDLQGLLYKYEPGDKVNLEVLRNGQEITLEVTLKEKPNKY